MIPACSDTPLHKSFVDCNPSCSTAASGLGWQPVNTLPDARTSVTMKRSYFSSCLGDVMYSLTSKSLRPPAMEYCILQIKNWRLSYHLTLSYSLTPIIFLLLSHKMQDCRKAMQDKDYKWGSVPRFKGSQLPPRQVIPKRQSSHSSKNSSDSSSVSNRASPTHTRKSLAVLKTNQMQDLLTFSLLHSANKDHHEPTTCLWLNRLYFLVITILCFQGWNDEAKSLLNRP